MPRGSPSLAASLGMVAATVALVGAAVPVRDGETGTAAVAALTLTIVTLGVFFARRHGVLNRQFGAPLAIASSAGVIVASLVALDSVGTVFSIPLVGDIPTLVVALVGAAGAAAVGVGDAFALPSAELYERAIATVVYSALGMIGFVAIQLWAIVLIALGLFVGLITFDPQVPATTEVVLSQSATVLGVGSVAAAYLLLSGKGVEYLDLRWPSVRDFGLLVAGFIVLLGTALAVSFTMDLLGTETATHGTIERGQQNPELLLLMVPASLLVVGPFEELLYRNVIQKSLYAYFSKPGAVVAASVPFALVHFPAYSGGSLEASLASLAVVLMLSLVLGTFYALSDNLVVPAVVHGGYNAIVFYNMYLAAL